MTCEPLSVLGLSRTGFMRQSGLIPAAWACRIGARPISPPSGATPELRDMFWALKGAASKPSSRRMRQKAAVRMDLPAFEQVPCSMRAGRFFLRMAGASEGVSSFVRAEARRA